MWNFFEFLIRDARSQQNQPLHKAIVKSCPTNIRRVFHPSSTHNCRMQLIFFFFPGDFAQTFRLFLGAGMCFQRWFVALICWYILFWSNKEISWNLYLLSLPQTITGIQIKGQCLESLKQRLEVFLFRAHLKIDCEQNEQNPEQWTSFRILPLLYSVEPHQEKKTFKNCWACQLKQIIWQYSTSVKVVSWWVVMVGAMWRANLVFPFSPASPWEGARRRDATPPPGKPNDVRLFREAGLYI